jgi:hypothetical protein
MESQDWVPGKYGSALDFDANDETLSRNDDADFDFGTGSFSVQSWVKHDGAITLNNDYILTKADTTNGGYMLYMDDSGDFCFAVDDDATWDPDASACTSGVDYDDSAWHQATGVKVASNDYRLYVDGILVATSTTNVTGTLSNTNTLYFAVYRDGTSRPWDGLIDETRIYNYARTQAQVAYDFNRGAPLGYWKLDECQGGTAYDSGSGANNGTVTIGGGGTNTSIGTCGGAAAEARFDGATGKRNASLEFDGNDDYVDMGDQSEFDWERTQAMTLEAWIKTSTNTGMSIVAKQDETLSGRGYELQFGSGGLFYMQIINTYGSNGVEVRSTNDLNYDDGVWHHVVGTYDGTSAASGINLYFDGKAVAMTTSFSNINATILNSVGLRIASRSDPTPQRYTGQIDEVKIFNYALTADQVKRDFNTGAVYFGPLEGSP